MPEEFVFLLLGRELPSAAVPARPSGLSKMSSKGAWLLLPLGLPARRKLLFLLCEEALFCPGDATLPSAGAVNADTSDREAVLSALQELRHVLKAARQQVFRRHTPSKQCVLAASHDSI